MIPCPYVRTSVCKFWDHFIAEGWVAFYQLVGGIFVSLEKAAKTQLPGGKIEMKHFIGDLKWATPVLPDVPTLIRIGKDEVGVSRLVVEYFKSESSKEVKQ